MTDPLADARGAYHAGRPELAVNLAWEAVRPAVLKQDEAVIRDVLQFAQEVSTTASGGTRDEAERLASYCAACILRPRDTNEPPWSLKRLLHRDRQPTKPCPDCAEDVHFDAKVCRYCGYRFPTPEA